MFYLIVKKEHVHFIYYNLAKYALPYSKNAIVVVNENNYYNNCMYNVHVSSKLGDPEKPVV